MNIKQVLKERRKAHLKDKFTVKGYVQRWHNTRIAATPTAYFLQFLTGCLAAGFAAWLIKLLTNSWSIGFAVGAVIIVAFEYFKRQAVNNSAIGFFNKGRLSIVGTALVVIFTAASITMSCFAVPILISEFSPMPVKPIESDVIKPLDDKLVKLETYWMNQKQDNLDKATEIHKQNNWKGVTTRDARKTKLSFESAAKAAQDTFNTLSARISAEKTAAYNAALTEYKSKVKLRNGEKSLVGMILGFVTLALELLFIFLYSWSVYYDFREALELGLITFESSKSDAKSTIEPKKVTPQVDKAGQRTNIGFQSEGKVILDGGKYKVWCKKANGELKLYDSAYLSTLIGQSQGTARHSYWLEMKGKINKAKNS